MVLPTQSLLLIGNRLFYRHGSILKRITLRESLKFLEGIEDISPNEMNVEWNRLCRSDYYALLAKAVRS